MNTENIKRILADYFRKNCEWQIILPERIVSLKSFSDTVAIDCRALFHLKEVLIMIIVSFKICPFVQRVLCVAELKGIKYDVTYISLMDKPDWFLEKSPLGQVPILIEDQGTLFDSNAISEYLEEQYPNKLHPDSAFVRATHRSWIELAAKNYHLQCRTQRSPTEEKLFENKNELDKALRKMEAVIGEGPYFSGSTICMVDAAWFVLLHRAEIIRKYTGFEFLDGFQKLLKWRTALMEKAPLLQSVSDDFDAEFMNFYLNEKTYLGQLMRDKSGCCGVREECNCTPELVGMLLLMGSTRETEYKPH